MGFSFKFNNPKPGKLAPVARDPPKSINKLLLCPVSINNVQAFRKRSDLLKRAARVETSVVQCQLDYEATVDRLGCCVAVITTKEGEDLTLKVEGEANHELVSEAIVKTAILPGDELGHIVAKSVGGPDAFFAQAGYVSLIIKGFLLLSSKPSPVW